QDILPRLSPLIFGNNGQACTAQTRVLVSRAHHDRFVEALCEKVRAFRVGDARDPATEIGPLVSKQQRDRVEGYLELGRAEGASAAVGGGRAKHLSRGWFIEPTVFTGVSNSMRIAREEIFGPVVVVIPYDGLEEATAIANDSQYGLAGTVWTNDL